MTTTVDAVDPAIAPARKSDRRLAFVDCDIHPTTRSVEDLFPYLSARWRQHLATYGMRHAKPFLAGSTYPRATPALSRRDAWPPNGSPPGSDLDFMRKQHLDFHDIQFGMLHLLTPTGMDQRNQEFGAAFCRAVNEWQFHEWTRKDRRLKGGIVVPGENAEAAVREIEHWAGYREFAQVTMVSHALEPLGRQRYWPIYAAAAAHGLPLGIHGSGENGHPISGAGWHSTYFEFHPIAAISMQSLVANFVTEGVFARFPDLKLVVIEGGFSWVPAVGWRLDQAWSRTRDEVPHLTRPPSEYIRENVWFTTQPADEPEHAADLRDVIDWIGWDRLMFSTDYPHWDSDDPRYAFRIRMNDAERRMIMYENAHKVYGLG